MYEVSEEFLAMREAEKAFLAAPVGSPGILDKLEAAEKVYFDKLGKLRAEWKAVPESLDKMAAEENASDTESTDIDQLKWFRIALATYQEIQDYKGD